MTRHPIAQIAPNGNPKSQETSALLPFSREIDYFSRRVSLGASTLTRFFTDDKLNSESKRRMGLASEPHHPPTVTVGLAFRSIHLLTDGLLKQPLQRANSADGAPRDQRRAVDVFAS